MFLRNAKDYILRIRNHPSIGLYCGRNEGIPPKPIDDGLRALIAGLHPGLHYIPSSAEITRTPYVVSGHGPYRAEPLKFYFPQRATPKLHSEMGMPNMLTLDSVKRHDAGIGHVAAGRRLGHARFHHRRRAGRQLFRRHHRRSYGGAKNVEDWVELAQFVNYDGYRAMFEAQSKNRMGLLLWMSHSCWPSFVWQTYDYYFDPTAAYFGIKKASEPLHIQWNPATDNVEVVNYSGGNADGPDRHRRSAEHGWRGEMGKDGHGGQPRRQRANAHQDGVSAGLDARAFHPPEADARRPGDLRELLPARRRRKPTSRPSAICPK